MSKVLEDLLDVWISASKKFCEDNVLLPEKDIKKKIRNLFDSAKKYYKDGRRKRSERQNAFLCDCGSMFEMCRCTCEIITCEDKD